MILLACDTQFKLECKLECAEVFARSCTHVDSFPVCERVMMMDLPCVPHIWHCPEQGCPVSKGTRAIFPAHSALRGQMECLSHLKAVGYTKQSPKTHPCQVLFHRERTFFSLITVLGNLSRSFTYIFKCQHLDQFYYTCLWSE